MDLETDKHAVSILQHELIKREETQWGNSRLAVEGKFCHIHTWGFSAKHN